MKQLLSIQQKLVPELLATITKRYKILQAIHNSDPVGRRTLAKSLDLTERVLRSEVEFLKSQKLIVTKSIGMMITEEGKALLNELEPLMKNLSGLSELEKEIKIKLNLNRVIIVPGDSDKDPSVKDKLGMACTEMIKNLLVDDNTIAVTGGTTIAAVADQLSSQLLLGKKALFVPARGGIGANMKDQANTICAKMAEKTRSAYRMLYVPDQVNQELYNSLLKDREIKEVIDLIKSANIVLHGIGDALTMANRRNTNENELNKIKQKKAVGEAFGYYFNEKGEVVHQISTIGLQLRDLKSIQHVVAVAGGASKAKAIHAYMKSGPHSTVLITDEAAAMALLGGVL